jgi:hypothetical protein
MDSYATYVNNVIYFSGNMTTGNVTEYNPIIPFSNGTDKFVYTILSNEILKTIKRTKFINALTDNVQSEYVQNSKEFIKTFLTQNWDITFDKLKKEEEKFADNFKSTQEYKIFENFNPLDENGVSLKNKERIMNYTTESPYWWINKALKDVYSTSNTNNNINLFNGKKQFNN